MVVHTPYVELHSCDVMQTARCQEQVLSQACVSIGAFWHIRTCNDLFSFPPSCIWYVPMFYAPKVSFLPPFSHFAHPYCRVHWRFQRSVVRILYLLPSIPASQKVIRAVEETPALDLHVNPSPRLGFAAEASLRKCSARPSGTGMAGVTRESIPARW